jgi:hypothetical protein
MTKTPETKVSTRILWRCVVAGWLCSTLASAFAVTPIEADKNPAPDVVARKNAPIFSGPDALTLAFDKPSDIIEKVSRRLPDDMTQARTSGWFSGQLALRGAYEPWGPEAAAFMSLWKCMPKGAWLYPQRNPFAQRVNDGGRMLWPIAMQQTRYEESDFGFCIDNRAGFGDTATPVLRSKFAALLNRQGCSGTGPDDCVLILRLWASLLPDDPELAAAMQRLEPETALESPLPEWPAAQPMSWKESDFALVDDRFAIALRRAAFLRAKLLSVLHAPSSWPSASLPATLGQMSRLYPSFDIVGPYISHRSMYPLHNNAAVNPWLVFNDAPERSEQFGDAILTELQRLAADPATDCDVFDPWLLHSGRFPITPSVDVPQPDLALQSRYVLTQWRSGRQARCAAPNYEWLRQQTDTDDRHVLYGYLALLNYLPASEYRTLADGLTDNGQACLGKAARPGWLEQTCEKRNAAADKATSARRGHHRR